MLTHVALERDLFYTPHKFAALRLGHLIKMVPEHLQPAVQPPLPEAIDAAAAFQDGEHPDAAAPVVADGQAQEEKDQERDLGAGDEVPVNDPAAAPVQTDDTSHNAFTLHMGKDGQPYVSHWSFDYIQRGLELSPVPYYHFVARFVKRSLKSGRRGRQVDAGHRGDSGGDDNDEDDNARKPVPFWLDIAADRKHPQHDTHGMCRTQLHRELVPVLYGSSVPLERENVERRAMICCLLFRPFRDILLIRDGYDTWLAAWEAHYAELTAKAAADDPGASTSSDPLDGAAASLAFINRWLECVTSMREGELESASERRKRQAARGIIEPRRTTKYDGLSYSEDHFTPTEEHDASQHYGSAFRARPLANRLAIPDLFARSPQGHFAGLVTSLWAPRIKWAQENASSSSSSSSSGNTTEQIHAAKTLASWDAASSFGNNTNALLRNQNNYISTMLSNEAMDDFGDDVQDTDGWYGAREVIVEDAYSVPNNEIRFPSVTQQLERYGLNHRQSIAFAIVAARFLHMLTKEPESTSVAKKAAAELHAMKLEAQVNQLHFYVAGAAGPCAAHTRSTLCIMLGSPSPTGCRHWEVKISRCNLRLYDAVGEKGVVSDMRVYWYTFPRAVTITRADTHAPRSGLASSAVKGCTIHQVIAAHCTTFLLTLYSPP
jgi:hypothetical protein